MKSFLENSPTPWNVIILPNMIHCMMIEQWCQGRLQGILPMDILAIMEMILNIESNPAILKDVPYSDHPWTQLLVV